MCVSVPYIEFTNFTCIACHPGDGWMSKVVGCQIGIVVRVPVCISPHMLSHPLSGSSVAVGRKWARVTIGTESP